VEYLAWSMGLLSNREIKKTDKEVISNVDSGYSYLDKLRVTALAMKGRDDYVATLDKIETTIVEGKHTSPLEEPEKVWALITTLIRQTKE
ncbi:MAG: hypothetical protein AAFU33_02420, partial [Bacteroidota bacterium]